jgi:hypothetical protein
MDARTLFAGAVLLMSGVPLAWSAAGSAAADEAETACWDPLDSFCVAASVTALSASCNPVNDQRMSCEAWFHWHVEGRSAVLPGEVAHLARGVISSCIDGAGCSGDSFDPPYEACQVTLTTPTCAWDAYTVMTSPPFPASACARVSTTASARADGYPVMQLLWQGQPQVQAAAEAGASMTSPACG